MLQQSWPPNSFCWESFLWWFLQMILNSSNHFKEPFNSLHSWWQFFLRLLIFCFVSCWSAKKVKNSEYIYTAGSSDSGVCLSYHRDPWEGKVSELLIVKAKIFRRGAAEKIKEFGSVCVLETNDFHFFQGWTKKEILKGRKNPFTITLEVIPHPQVSVIKYFIKQKEILIYYFKSSPAGNSLISKGRSTRCIGQEQ